ncbi:MAG: hypothetical protein ACI4F0_11055 [Agathobacter sp.]
MWLTKRAGKSATNPEIAEGGCQIELRSRPRIKKGKIVADKKAEKSYTRAEVREKCMKCLKEKYKVP